jgi:hypothetical protein
MAGIRIKIMPRDVPSAAIARLLGISEDRFNDCLPDLLPRGLPGPDSTTGNYDMKAVQAWQDRRSGLFASPAVTAARDAAAVLEERIAAMRR